MLRHERFMGHTQCTPPVETQAHRHLLFVFSNPFCLPDRPLPSSPAALAQLPEAPRGAELGPPPRALRSAQPRVLRQQFLEPSFTAIGPLNVSPSDLPKYHTIRDDFLETRSWGCEGCIGAQKQCKEPRTAWTRVDPRPPALGEAV